MSVAPKPNLSAEVALPVLRRSTKSQPLSFPFFSLFTAQVYFYMIDNDG